MASDLLHIKDAYYFEVPKFLWTPERDSMDEFPDFWVRLDEQFQHWEADRLAHELEDLVSEAPDAHALVHQWEHWQHAGEENHGRPLDVYLEMAHDDLLAEYKGWKAADPGRASMEFVDYLNETDPPLKWFVVPYATSERFQRDWSRAKDEAGDVAEFRETISWSDAKIEGYSKALQGKILIPQPFGELRNLYQRESGFAISKFMILQVVTGLILVLVFSWLARRMQQSEKPKGRAWNLLESVLLFIRDEIARPAIGGHHDDHGHDDHGRDDHGRDDHDHAHADEAGGHEAGVRGVHDEHEKADVLDPAAHSPVTHGPEDAVAAYSAHARVDPADRFVPLLWTIFVFILGCNLFGMVPWAGAPTASIGVTSALALITFGTVVLAGMKQFGPLGFFANQVPSMDLPAPIAVLIKPMVFVIELLGLMIKHAVLAIRLVANMVAGHLVLLGLMGLAFGAHAAHQFQGEAASMWGVTATAAVLGSTLFSCLELFVAFLQAYIFTLLSALFIGAGVHKH